jgi:hypothetical protein
LEAGRGKKKGEKIRRYEGGRRNQSIAEVGLRISDFGLAGHTAWSIGHTVKLDDRDMNWEVRII